ncbi:MAG: hypothetical protein E6G92_11010 [Alphaproteobacteria bacterium]|nr:MAG: hypothetical protein E6G92_11010 [Alphaproteobacteria bacterium]
MRSILPVLTALCAASTAALAGPFPPTALLSIGYREARLADFEGTPGQAQRRAAPDGLLSLTADLNGDGRDDEVRILLNQERQLAYVAAAIVTEKLDTYVLRRVPLDEAADIGLRDAPPRLDGRHGVTIFSLSSGRAETLYLAGEEFEATGAN